MKIQDSPQPSRRSIEVLGFLSCPGEGAALPYLSYACQRPHSFSPEGRLVAPPPLVSPAALLEQGCAPLLLLSNLNEGGGFSAQLAHSLFADKSAVDTLAAELIAKLEAGGYYGLQLSFNYLFPFDREDYSAFAAKLSELLHRHGFLLSIELAPWEGAGLGSALSAGQDYKALGKAADRLSLMFCRWAHRFSPPQALAPFPALHAALSHALEHIPAEKLLLGISGIAYDWPLPWRQGDEARPIPLQWAMELARSQRSSLRFDSAQHAPWFLYTDPESIRHIIFLEDAQSLGEKLSLADKFSLAGISLYPADRPPSYLLQSIERLHSTEKLL